MTINQSLFSLFEVVNYSILLIFRDDMLIVAYYHYFNILIIFYEHYLKTIYYL